MRILHASERYGHLTRDGKAVTDDQAARRCGIEVELWIALRDELIEFDLLKWTGDRILYSPELVAQAEWRSKGAKRQKSFQDKKRGDNNDSYNDDITPDITPNSRPNSNSFSSSKEKEKENGGRPGPPAAGAFASKWQWSELTDEEKQMSDAVFATHLQKLHSKKNVREIAKKVADYCRKHKIAFALERVKGWVEGEHKTVNEQEFLDAFGAEEGQKSARQIAIESCSKCDERGLVQLDGKFKECNHK